MTKEKVGQMQYLFTMMVDMALMIHNGGTIMDLSVPEVRGIIDGMENEFSLIDDSDIKQLINAQPCP